MRTVLNSDIHPLDNIKGQYHSFALNVILKDGIIQTEFGNQEVHALNGKELVGGVYIDNIGHVLFLSRPDGLSEIGVLNEKFSYSTEVVADLGFNIMNPIDAVFRKKDGCGVVLYWVDGKNKPRRYVLGNPDDFKDGNGDFIPDLFNLQMNFKVFPKFNVEVENNGGNLKPGTYQVGFRYVDKDGNPGDIVEITGPFIIYDDDLYTDWSAISGGAAKVETFEFGHTNKSLRVEITDFDNSYDRYQLVFIEKNTGNGSISKVVVSNIISSSQRVFIYDGKNFLREINKNEVIKPAIIKTANTITIDDENLVLGNISYDTEDSCELQKYASKIAADLELREVVIGVMDDKYNPKHPESIINAGYMPGEVYSFGIVYKFDDGTYSKVYHIPGKPDTVLDQLGNNVAWSLVYDAADNRFPMSNTGNTNESLTYTSKCNFYGTDIHGNKLEGNNVRFHRFPFRSEINAPFVEGPYTSENTVFLFKCISVKLTSQDANIPDYPNSTVQIKFKADGVEYIQRFLITQPNINGTLFQNITTDCIEAVNITDIDISIVDSNTGSIMTNHNIDIEYTIKDGISNNVSKIYKVYAYNIHFSNIKFPDESLIGKKVVGYKIVRQVVKEQDKKILDSAVTYNILKDKDFKVAGPLSPSVDYTDWVISEGTDASRPISGSNEINKQKIVEKEYGILSPSIITDSFDNRPELFVETHDIINTSNGVSFGISNIIDVIDGSTYNPDADKEEDKDGMSLKLLRKTSEVVYTKIPVTEKQIKDLYVLSPLDYKDSDGLKVVNANTVLRTGILELNDNLDGRNRYGYLIKENNTPYTDFEIAEYISIGDGVLSSFNDTSSITVSGGDTYIFPYTAYSLMYHSTIEAYRKKKSWFSRFIAGTLLMIIGIALASLTGGASLGISAYGYSLLRSGLKLKHIETVFKEFYDEGLRDALKCWTLNEYYFFVRFANASPNGFSVLGEEDDKIRWFMTVLSPVWFESRINLALKYKLDDKEKYFMDSPIYDFTDDYEDTTYQGGFRTIDDLDKQPKSYSDKYGISKLTEISDNKLTYRLPIPDYVYINPDYGFNDLLNTFVPPVESMKCCNECLEKLPHRFVWSDYSSVDNIIDKYRIIRPNNYRDLEKFSGSINNLFSKTGKLYIHTDTGLYVSGRKVKEKVVDDVVVVVGSGEKYSIPPVKLAVEGDYDTGLPYKGAQVLTDSGYYWHNPKAEKFFKLGDSITVLSSNIENISERYFSKPVGNLNTPLAKFGSGYTTIFDKQVNRVLFTKIDNDATINENNLYCEKFGNLYVIDNFKNVIAEMEHNGYTYKGIRDCSMLFIKTTDTSYTQNIVGDPYNVADYHLVVVYNNTVLDVYDFQNIINQALTTEGSQTCPPIFKSIRFVQRDNSNIFEHFNYIAENFTSEYQDENVIIYDFTSTTNDLTDYCSIGTTNDIRNIDGSYKNSFLFEYDKFYGTNISGNNSTGIRNKNIFNTVITINSPYVISHTKEIDIESHTLQYSTCNIEVYDNNIRYQQEMLKIYMGNNSLTAQQKLSVLMSDTSINPNYFSFGYGTSSIDELLNTEPDTDTPFTQLSPSYDLHFVFNNDEDISGVICRILTEIYGDSTAHTEYGIDYNINLYDINTEIVQIPFTQFSSIDKRYIDYSATISYNIMDKAFIAFHSYRPHYYIQGRHSFLSYNDGKLFEHNNLFNNTHYYGKKCGMIYEKHIVSKNTENDVYSTIYWDTQTTDNRGGNRNFKTFDKIIVYNEIQSTGNVQLEVNHGIDMNVRQDRKNRIRRRSKFWYFNGLRDIIVEKSEPFWIDDRERTGSECFIDKIHTDILNKDWNKKARLKGRYLTIRLFFSNFEGYNMKLSNLGIIGQKHKVQ